MLPRDTSRSPDSNPRLDVHQRRRAVDADILDGIAEDK